MKPFKSLVCAAALTVGGAASAQSPHDICARKASAFAPAADLHCIDLIPAPDFPSASGAAELLRVPTPFGVAVTADGRHMWNVRVTVAGLPEPATLGAFRTFVAWAASPTFERWERIGELRGGTATGRVALNSFLVLVSAESDAGGAERRGRLVLRGASASTLMRPYDLTALPPRLPQATHAHGATYGGWPMPPMHPGVPVMLPGLEEQRPPVAPFRPGQGRDLASLPRARPREVIALADGDSFALEATIVRRNVAGREIVAYGFNGQWPGPLIRVARASRIVVHFRNGLDMPTAVHWHGLRHDNRFDGVPHVTQEPVAPGRSFRYEVRFPDAGIYWYHPHHREDVQQDLGLYGNLLVRSERPDFFAPANRDEVLMLDDFLVADSAAVPHGLEFPTHALMGRFGNVLLVNGEPRYQLRVKRGEVVRFYFTNAANTRPFNISIPGAQLKLVGGDVGKMEREEWIDNVVIAPAERWIVDARFERSGVHELRNQVQAIDHARGAFFPEAHTLGEITVSDTAVAPDHAAAFGQLRANADVAAELDRYRRWFDGPPARELLLTLRADRLPFGLVQLMRLDTGYVNPVEWSGTMPMMDWLSTGREVEWVLREPSTRRENMAIDWTFRQGDVVRMRLANDRHTLHPMQHPIHIHGQRFLVLAQNGVANQNLVWKDTFMLPVGWTAELLVEMSNPGRWMLHCHIAEHLEAGMHTVFTVLPAR